MVINYIKIALRNLKRDKGFSYINIVGLTVGLMATIAIGLWIQSEYRYDRFYSHTDRLYEVYTSDTFQNEKHAWGGTAAILGPTLAQEYGEVEAMTRTTSVGSNYVMRVGKNKFTPVGLAPDSTFFKLFDFPFIAGNKENALRSPNDVILTKSLAISLFGKTEVIGQTIAFDTLSNFIVSGVIEDIPENSRFSNIEYFCSWDFVDKTLGNIYYSSWTSYNHKTYVLLRPNTSFSSFNQKLSTFVSTHDPDKSNKASVFLHPANKWHLYNKSENGKMVAGRLNTVRLFIVIAIFILLLACINFTNLSTARSEKRAREVGVRKVVGASKKSLVGQFLTESIFLSFIAGILSVMLLVLLLPWFGVITDRQLSLGSVSNGFWLVLFLFIIITGIIAGLYPAFFLSSFQPVKTLKGTFTPVRGIFTPRKILVVLQFVFSVTLISSTLIVKKQIEHVQKRDIGYDENNLVYVSLNGNARKNYAMIKQELIDRGAAVSITKSLGPITSSYTNGWGFSWPGSRPEDYDLVFQGMSSDADFSATMKLELVSGRDIDIFKFPTDSNAVLLNETAAKRIGVSDPLGMEMMRGKGEEYEEKWHVVGIVKDFIFQSPYEAIEPLIIYGPFSWFNFMHIRLNPDNSLADNKEIIEDVFRQYNPDHPLKLSFVDEAYSKKFAEEQRIGKLVSVFSGLANLIACLGLMGLASYTAQQKVKEIGIRKVLGASVSRIVGMLSTEFVKLILISILISTPIAWWLMNKWLGDYAYRIEMQWWMFAMAGLIAILIALLTVSGQAFRAALTKPVDSLRDE